MTAKLAWIEPIPTDDDPGWGHYDACPAAHGDDPDECCCDELAAEYDDRPDPYHWEPL